MKTGKPGFLNGVVFDSLTGENLEFVSIRLFSNQDSSVIGGVLSDSAGKFSLEIKDKTKGFLRFSFVGYETKNVFSLSQFTEQMFENLKIGLVPSNFQEVGEVEIVGNKDILKTGIDKKVYNVGEDLNNQGGSASDVLNNVPSIEVDQDGNISLRGDGNVIILIDGRPSTLTLNNGLGGLPANSIERIEVVTNPSAKYDPDGTSGIINIVLKKAKLRGVNGTISATIGTGNSYNGTATFNVRTGNLNIFGTYANSYVDGYRNFFSTLERSTANGTTLLDQTRPGDHLRLNQNLRLGMDYNIKPNQIIGFSVNGALGKEDRTGILENIFYDEYDATFSSFKRSADDINETQNLDVNVNYAIEFKNKGKLTSNVTSSFGDDEATGVYENTYGISNYLVSMQPALNQRLEKTENNRVTTGQLDFEKSYEKRNIRMETGAKVILRNQDIVSFSETRDTISGNYLSDTLANFRYNYKERIYATYFILGQQKGKWKYQVGVRGEYAQQIPNLIDDSIAIVNDYLNLFPSAHLRYALKEKQEISLSYSRRINRATSEQLNPFINYSDPLNLRSGNPYLRPEYIHSIDLGYSIEAKKLNFTSSVFYRYTTDVLSRVKVFYNDNVTATIFGNIDESHSYGVEAVINHKTTKWWRNTISINGSQIQYFNAVGNNNFNNSGFNLNIKYAGTVDFWKKTASIQVNVRYNTPRITPQGKVLPRSVAEISGNKKLNEHWNVGFRVSDVFDTQGFRYDFQQEDFRQKGEFKWLSRRLYVTITYKFGRLEMDRREPKGGENSGGGSIDF